MQPAVYILASKKNGTLYVGVTSSLKKRVYEHKSEFVDGFSSKYKVHHLVYYELLGTMYEAISREKQLKNWRRDWKVALIDKFNPCWKDLFSEI